MGRAQTRAHEVTPQKGEVREGWPNSLLLKTWQYRFNPHPLTQSWPSGGFDDKSDNADAILVILVVDNQKGKFFFTHFVNFGNEGGSNVTKKIGNIMGKVILEKNIAAGAEI